MTHLGIVLGLIDHPPPTTVGLGGW
jgi:hypothetical protein